MSEQKEKSSQQLGKSQYLDTVIDCITQRATSPNKKQQPPVDESMNLPVLYNKAEKMISQFDKSINTCIKFKQARINRNYEIIITDLQAQIKKLSQKLKLEQDARSPTKKHVSDILDKLVIFRDENNKLKEQIKIKNQRINELQTQLAQETKALLKIQNEQPRTIVQRLPAISASGTVAQAIKNYLKDKQLVRKITNKSASKLQKFLYQNKAKSWNWTIPVLLDQLEKWSAGIVPQKNQVDMWKIRSNIARKFSDYIDNSNNLTKPSRISSIAMTQANTPREQKYFTSRKIDSFSYNGSKQKLNMSVI